MRGVNMENSSGLGSHEAARTGTMRGGWVGEGAVWFRAVRKIELRGWGECSFCKKGECLEKNSLYIVFFFFSLCIYKGNTTVAAI